MKSLIASAPEKYTLRDCQVESLSQLESMWNSYDVFVLNSPVASGKSLQAVAIASWMRDRGHSTAILTPQVLLQDQYTDEFTDIPSLKGKARYTCHTKGVKNCDEHYTALTSYCADCPYQAARNAVRESAVGIYNLYSYMFDDNFSDVLIVDEAHSIASQLQEFYTIRLWKHEEHYPDTLHTQGDAVMWMEGQIPKLEQLRSLTEDKKKKIEYGSKISKFRALIDGINRDPGHFFYEKKYEAYRGTVREVIEIRPVTLQHTKRTLWKTHKKIVLMSATINYGDVEYLGLKGKRVTFIEVNSPIPAENRPIIVRPTAQMSHQNLAVAVPRLCAEILALAEEHKGKGMIHITYGLVPLFKKYLPGDRFLWHTQADRMKVYDKFRKSDSNPILMACGMSEGIDLAGEVYEWQVIAKIQFPSLMDALVRRQKEAEPNWYAWQAVKVTIQQTGRICRSPTDRGVTYILDSSFNFLYHKNRAMFPKYVQAAIKWSKRGDPNGQENQE